MKTALSCVNFVVSGRSARVQKVDSEPTVVTDGHRLSLVSIVYLNDITNEISGCISFSSKSLKRNIHCTILLA